MSKIEDFKTRGLGIDGVTETCRECRGSGEVTRPGRRPATCWPCKGSGRVKKERTEFRRR